MRNTHNDNPRPSGPLAVGLVLVCLFMGVGAGCGEGQGRQPADVFVPGVGDVTSAPLQYIEFGGCPDGAEPALGGTVCPTVNLESIACSAAIGCRDGFLRDPLTEEPAFTLTTSLTCGFELQPDPNDPVDVFDSLPSYATRLRCVDAGGVVTVPPAPSFGQHRFFAQNTNLTGDFFLNTAQIVGRLFEPSPTPVSCTVESWATLNFQRVFDEPPEGRTARVNHWAPVVQWQAVLTPDGAGFDCGDSWVKKHVVFATVHDLPDKTTKTDYPASHASILLQQQVFTDPVGARVFNALEGIAWAPVLFPNAPNVPPVGFEKRLFTVPYPSSAALPPDQIGRPASITAGWSCAETDPDGKITHVGFVFTFDGYEETLPPAIIVIDRTLGGDDWDCVRASPEDMPVCRPYGDSYDTSWREVVPCLISHVPTDVPPTCDVLTAGDIGSSQTLCAGLSPEQLSGTAPTGGIGPWTYRWESSADGSAWTEVAGAIDASYLPPAATGTALYRRVATNDCGTATSGTVSVTVAAPLDGGEIADSQELCAGDQAAALISLSAATGGLGTIDYSWESTSDGLVWDELPGALGQSYPPGAVASTRAFRRVATNDCGVSISNVLNIDVALPAEGGTIAGDQTVCPSGPVAVLSEVAPGAGGRAPTTYSWQRSINGINFSAVGGATGSSYTPPGLTATTAYRRVFNTTCGSPTSNDVVVIVSELNAGAVTGATTVCYGAGAILSNSNNATTQLGPLAYQWRSGTSGATLMPVAGAINPSSFTTGPLTATTVFDRQVTDSCTTMDTGDLVVTVRADLTAGSVGSHQTICQNTAPSLLTQVTAATGGDGSYTYQWQSRTESGSYANISGATAATYQPGSLSEKTRFRRVVTSGSGCGSATSAEVIITVNPALLPGAVAASQTVCYNADPAAFTSTSAASAGLGAYSYQWQESTNGTSFTNLASATGLTYDAAALTATRYYRRFVTDSCESVNTPMLTVTVRPQLTAGSVRSDQTICANTTPAALTQLTAPTGGDSSYTYQWQSRTESGSYANISGATGATYQPGVIAETTRFQRIVTSGSGCGSATSNEVVITINPALAGGVIAAAQTICYGADVAAFTSTSGATGGLGAYSYAWQISTNGTAFTPIGATGLTYNEGTLTANRWYKRIASDICSAADSNVLAITVRAVLTAGSVGGSQTVCPGGNPSAFTSVLPTGGQGNYTYQWESSPDGANGWTTVPSATLATLDLASVATTTYYRRKVTDGCGVMYSNSLVVTVSDLTAGSVAASQSICYSTSPAAFTSTAAASGGVGAPTYQWQASPTPNAPDFVNIASATAATYGPPTLTTTTYYRRNATNTCGLQSTAALTVAVAGPVVAGVIESNQTVCPGGVPSPLHENQPPTGGLGQWTYQWQESPDGTAWADIPGAKDSVYAPEALEITTYFRRLDINDCDQKFTNTVRITVSGLVAGGISASQTICYGAVAAAFTSTPDASGGVGTIGYTWSRSTNGGSSWSPIANAISAGYPAGALTQTTQYYRTASNTCGSAQSNTLTVTVRAALTSGSIGSAQTICRNTVPALLTQTVAPTGGDGSYTYQWQSRTESGSYANISGATAATYQPGSLSEKTRFRRVVTSGSGCGSATSAEVIVTIYGSPVGGGIAADQTICYNTIPSAFTNTSPATGGTGSFTYKWRISADSSNFADIPGATGLTYGHPSALSATRWFTREASDGCATVDANVLRVTVLPNLFGGSITADQTVCPGGNPVLFSSTAGASGGSGVYAYQWQQRLPAGVWGDIANATSATYDPPPGLSQTTEYRRRVISSACAPAYSNAVTVSVSPLVAGDIAADQLICHGTAPEALTSLVPAGGGVGGLIYQWQSSLDASSFDDIPAANDGETYSPNALTSDTWFRRRVSNTCAAVETSSVRVRVTEPLDPGIIKEDQVVCAGKLPREIVSQAEGSGGFGPGEYRWELSTDGDRWDVIPEARDPQYQPEDRGETTLYRRIYIDACGEKESNIVKVSVADLQPGAIAVGQSLCWGASPSLFTSSVDAFAGKTTPTYQWRSSIDLSAWSDIAGATSTTYQAAGLFTTTYFVRRADDTCGAVDTSPLTVSVASQLSGGRVGSNQTVCPGATPSLLTSITSGSGGLGGSTYQWESSPDNTNWSPVANGQVATYQPTSVPSTTYFRRRYQNSCGTAYSNTVTVLVSALSAGSIQADQEICFNANPATLTNVVAASGGVGAISYTWQTSQDASGWTNIAASNSPNYSPPRLTSTTYYRRSAQNTCGTVYTAPPRITVAEPVSAGEIVGDQIICSGGDVQRIDEARPAHGGLGEISYVWMQSTDGVHWEPIPGEREPTYRPFAVMQTTWYQRVAINDCDIAESNVVRIRVVDGGIIGPESQAVPRGERAQGIDSFDDGGARALGGFFTWERLVKGRWEPVPPCDGSEWCESDFIDTSFVGSFVYRRVVTFEACEGAAYESNYVALDVTP